MTGIVLAAFLTWIVGIVKAFSCGSLPAKIGGSGTLWGFAILIFGILIGPVGLLLAIIFLVSGGCQQIPPVWKIY